VTCQWILPTASAQEDTHSGAVFSLSADFFEDFDLEDLLKI
jgi:hypothetical protein